MATYFSGLKITQKQPYSNDGGNFTVSFTAKADGSWKFLVQSVKANSEGVYSWYLKYPPKEDDDTTTTSGETCSGDFSTDKAGVTYNGKLVFTTTEGAVEEGAISFYVAVPRPATFSWDTATIGKGETINIVITPGGEKKLAPLTAEEWNKYCANVQEVAEYKGVTLSSMPTVSRYATMEKDTINDIINKLRTIPDINTSKIPAIVTKGQPIKASTFISLRDAINSVP